MDMSAFRCRGCSRFGTRSCTKKAPTAEACDAFESWPELLVRGMAALERGQRLSYLIVILLAGVALVALALPRLMG